MPNVDFNSMPDLATIVSGFGTTTSPQEVPDLWDVIILVVTIPVP